MKDERRKERGRSRRTEEGDGDDIHIVGDYTCMSPSFAWRWLAVLGSVC